MNSHHTTDVPFVAMALVRLRGMPFEGVGPLYLHSLS